MLAIIYSANLATFFGIVLSYLREMSAGVEVQ